jgi:hypothetical protein
MDITSYINFACFKYLISFKLKLINSFLNLFFFGKNEHMKYICDKLILVTKFEKLRVYFKTRVVNGNI